MNTPICPECKAENSLIKHSLEAYNIDQKYNPVVCEFDAPLEIGDFECILDGTSFYYCSICDYETKDLSNFFLHDP